MPMKGMTASQLARECAEMVHDDSYNPLVNVLVTLKCNFHCDHCMMRSGPEAPGGWMTSDTFERIVMFAREIDPVNDGARVMFNFVGGEPTLKPGLLGRFLDRLEHGGFSLVEMTTNGWWLKNRTAFVNVVTHLRRHLYGGLTVRISSSEFHDLFRSETLKRKLKDPDILRKAVGEGMCDWFEHEAWMVKGCCGSCGHECEVGSTYGSECPECGNWVDPVHTWKSSVFEDCVAALWHAVDGSRCYVDRQQAWSVSANGRAADFQLSSESASCGTGADDLKFSFNPDGTIHDFCCNGGPHPGGHVDEGLVLLLVRTAFMDHLRRKMGAASSYGADWRKSDACLRCPGIAAKALRPGSPVAKTVMAALPLLKEQLDAACAV